jgi:hypothetical protein
MEEGRKKEEAPNARELIRRGPKEKERNTEGGGDKKNL